MRAPERRTGTPISLQHRAAQKFHSINLQGRQLRSFGGGLSCSLETSSPQPALLRQTLGDDLGLSEAQAAKSAAIGVGMAAIDLALASSFPLASASVTTLSWSNKCTDSAGVQTTSQRMGAQARVAPGAETLKAGPSVHLLQCESAQLVWQIDGTDIHLLFLSFCFATKPLLAPLAF